MTPWAIGTQLDLVRKIHAPQLAHAQQSRFLNLVKSGQRTTAFQQAFAEGDVMFSTPFNALDGVGANVGNGQRFTRVPRADLSGPGQWAAHVPPRATGPNANSCSTCHNHPSEDGSGNPSNMTVRDPRHTGQLSGMITRDTPHLFGLGATQRLAEEMTARLQMLRADAITTATTSHRRVTRDLMAKGVSFGTLTARPDGSVDSSGVEGVSQDLVVRPFQWKGSVAFIRDFVRDAANNELGMQGTELVGDGVDGDGDGVADELEIGDLTVLTVYLAAQPRPTTRVELARLGLIPPLSTTETSAIVRGAILFLKVGCATCHIPSMTLESNIFSEPSQRAEFRDTVFPGGQDPVTRGLDPRFPITFDLSEDTPENIIKDSSGQIVKRMGSFETDAKGHALVRLFGDLKRHDMGPGLAESIDEVSTGASVFLTRNLWGVGTTAPYLHDGRATTLTEAILEHGGEASLSQNSFVGLPEGSQKDLIAYLNNLVLFKQ